MRRITIADVKAVLAILVVLVIVMVMKVSLEGKGERLQYTS
jgi:hypothetical protein